MPPPIAADPFEPHFDVTGNALFDMLNEDPMEVVLPTNDLPFGLDEDPQLADILGSNLYTPPQSPPDPTNDLPLPVKTEEDLLLKLGAESPLESMDDLFRNDLTNSQNIDPNSKIPSAQTDEATDSSEGNKRKKRRNTKGPLTPEALQEQMLKKQRRMLKNRESASLSRKRKKEQMENLQKQVADLSEKNSQLSSKVDELEKEKLQMESEMESMRNLLNNTMPDWKARLSGPNASLKAAATTLMVCLFCFSLFGAVPKSSMTTQPPSMRSAMQLSPEFATSHHMSRTLKSTDVALRTNQRQQEISSSAVAAHRQEIETYEGVDEYELDAWLAKHNLLTHNATLLGTNSTNTDLKPTIRAPSVFRFDENMRSDLLRSFKRRKDTSYVLCSEASVLAASSPSQSRPLLSLVMPIPQENHEKKAAAVQVDCEITGSQRVVPVERA